MTVLSLWHGEVSKARTSAPPTMRQIVADVAEIHGVSLEDLLGPSHKRKFAEARQEAMLWCILQKRWDGLRAYSSPRIGAFFGRDHSTVLTGCRRAAQRLGGWQSVPVGNSRVAA
jgi:chromosomal replication initiator protein